jgi:DNA-binding transcriptional LysR family regulator
VNESIDLNLLRHFYEVARLKSFTKAAKSLRIGQPAISRAIRSLEQKEGIRLFDRSTRGGVHLTAPAQRLYESCIRIFAEVETLRSILSTERDECVGTLAVGASDNVCNYLMPTWAARFLNLHPRVSLNLFSGTSEAILTELRESRIEIGLFYTPVTQPGFTTLRLYEVEFALIAPRDTQWQLRDLDAQTYVGSRSTDYAAPYPALAMLHSVGVRPTKFVQANVQETQKRMVLAAVGYSVMPRFMVERELKAKELVEIETHKRLSGRLHLVRREGRTLTKPAEVFREFLKSIAYGRG